MEETKIIMPVIALRGLTILPNMILHFDISRDRSVKAIEKAMISGQQVFLITQRSPEDEKPELNDLYHVGTIANVKQLLKMPGNMVRVLVEGTKKGRLLDFLSESPILIGEIEALELADDIEPGLTDAYIKILKEKLKAYGNLNAKWGTDTLASLLAEEDTTALMNQIMIQLPLGYESRQRFLETETTTELFELICVILEQESAIHKIKRELQDKVREKVDKNQKDYILREQMKVIQEELSEDGSPSDTDAYEAQLETLDAADELKEKIAKDIRRLKGMPAGSQEGNVLRGYIETLLELPWDKASKDDTNLLNAKTVLDEDHYGLKDVKDRILEFLAVRSLTNKGESPIICLAGPPGTGKSSIAKSVARALNKEYVRISLGGIRDEAEIRGHRKTYVGAMPGRIVTALKQAGTKNPVILLDEIDKVSRDYKGDTAAALLEVLDSDQNKQFRDHYIEHPVDLSEVLFIATANTVQTISGPLLDRMELIQVSSYTDNEKYHIAFDYLIAKQMKKNGLGEGQLTISRKALEKIIRGYTKEAGVRNLERRIGSICRKAARELLEKNKKRVAVTEKNLEKYLGKERYVFDSINEEDEVGIVKGLAWTMAGGDTLSIEVNALPGKGGLELTGQLGDVMKESAKTALSYVRSASDKYEVEMEFFQQHDIHIHIPEGAVPKDGPSAGITMATAMMSVAAGKKVRRDVAMTGEVTLRGRVLPIGGLKEKLLAAKQARVAKVLVPVGNTTDVKELSEEIIGGMEIIYVKSMPEVLDHAFR